MLIFIQFVLGSLSIVFLILSISMLTMEKRRKKVCTQLVEAEITEIIKVESTDFDTISPTVSWYSIYKYWTGLEWRYRRSDVGGKEKKYQIGQKIELYINPNKTEEIYCPIDNTKCIRMILGIVGIGMAIVCVVINFLEI